MTWPLTLSDISLWLAVMAILLLVTSELLSSSTEYSRNIVIDKKNIRLTAFALGIGFMATVIIRMVQPL